MNAAERAKRRGTWAGKLLALGEPDVPVEMSALSVSQRLGELYELSQRAFALTHQPWPTYTRAEMPGRLRALTDHD